MEKALLNDFIVLRLYGEDTSHFLQSQLTQDIKRLHSDNFLWTAYCSPKGRVLGTGLIWMQGNEFYLMTHHSLEEVFTKKLTRFILRLNVKVEVTSKSVYAVIPNVSYPAYTRTNDLLFHLPYTQTPRALSFQDIEAPEMNQKTLTNWLIEDYLYPTPWTTERNKDLFLIQQLNLDTTAIQGVSFLKGCYPGQEIVARMHYKAPLKRRLYATKTTRINPHILESYKYVFSEKDLQTDCGKILSARVTDEETYLLIEVPIKTVNNLEKLYLSSQKEHLLEIIEPAYSLEKPIIIKKQGGLLSL